MKYTQPTLALLGAALGAIRNPEVKDTNTADNEPVGSSFITASAYQADE